LVALGELVELLKAAEEAAADAGEGGAALVRLGNTEDLVGGDIERDGEANEDGSLVDIA
jgi:hypothetical protein